MQFEFDKFLAGLPVRDSDGSYVLTEDIVNKYIVDLMNSSGIDTELRYKDGQYFIHAYDKDILSNFVNKYIVDLMNEAGIDTELRYKDGQYFIHAYDKDILSNFAPNPDDPVESLVNTAKWLVNKWNELPGMEAWYNYKRGIQSFTIREKPIE